MAVIQMQELKVDLVMEIKGSRITVNYTCKRYLYKLVIQIQTGQLKSIVIISQQKKRIRNKGGIPLLYNDLVVLLRVLPWHLHCNSLLSYR